MDRLFNYIKLLYSSELDKEELNTFLYFSLCKVLLPFVATIFPVIYIMDELFSDKSLAFLFLAVFFLMLMLSPKIASIFEFIIHPTFLTLAFICRTDSTGFSALLMFGMIVSTILLLLKTVVAIYKIVSYWPIYGNPFKILLLK